MAITVKFDPGRLSKWPLVMMFVLLFNSDKSLGSTLDVLPALLRDSNEIERTCLSSNRHATRTSLCPTTSAPTTDILYFPHIMKSGGTSLSCLLTNAVGVNEVVPISSVSSHTRFQDFRKDIGTASCTSIQKYKVMFGHPWPPERDCCATHTVLASIHRKLDYIIMVRDPFAHRLSWFNEAKYAVPHHPLIYRNLTAYLQSDRFALADQTTQLDSVVQVLYCGKSFKAMNISGLQLALAVINDPRVKVIMTTETFSTIGMCALHQATNLTFMNPPASHRFKHSPFTMTPEEINLISKVAAHEIIFYEQIQRHVLQKYSEDGVCDQSKMFDLNRTPTKHTNLPPFTTNLCMGLSTI